MTARGRNLLAAGLVLVVLGLVLGGVAFALSSAADDGAEGDGGPGTATTPAENGDGTPPPDGGPDDGTVPDPDGGTTTTTGGAGTGTTDGTSAPGTPDATVSTVTAPPDTPAALLDRLAEVAAAAGFPVLVAPEGDWQLAGVDGGETSQGPYVALTYQRDATYFSTSQERAAPFPEIPNTQVVTVRGVQGDLLDMGHVVVIRWVESGSGVIFSTNLPRAEAQVLVEGLRLFR